MAVFYHNTFDTFLNNVYYIYEARNGSVSAQRWKK